MSIHALDMLQIRFTAPTSAEAVWTVSAPSRRIISRHYRTAWEYFPKLLRIYRTLSANNRDPSRWKYHDIRLPLIPPSPETSAQGELISCRLGPLAREYTYLAEYGLMAANLLYLPLIRSVPFTGAGEFPVASADNESLFSGISGWTPHTNSDAKDIEPGEAFPGFSTYTLYMNGEH
ncbi:hypothetical protein [Ferviditalea candida]|uniref:Uncharacterized protein n=1 Tax=Ferviditalea candida TaxID=3108399 RepID=A0ABU5ZFT6_9BACL|nr:hypothetical protein [Paenibacillaceae bacterium T2]